MKEPKDVIGQVHSTLWSFSDARVPSPPNAVSLVELPNSPYRIAELT